MSRDEISEELQLIRANLRLCAEGIFCGGRFNDGTPADALEMITRSLDRLAERVSEERKI